MAEIFGGKPSICRHSSRPPVGLRLTRLKYSNRSPNSYFLSADQGDTSNSSSPHSPETMSQGIFMCLLILDNERILRPNTTRNRNGVFQILEMPNVRLKNRNFEQLSDTTDKRTVATFSKKLAELSTSINSNSFQLKAKRYPLKHPSPR